MTTIAIFYTIFFIRSKNKIWGGYFWNLFPILAQGDTLRNFSLEYTILRWPFRILKHQESLVAFQLSNRVTTRLNLLSNYKKPTQFLSKYSRQTRLICKNVLMFLVLHHIVVFSKLHHIERLFCSYFTVMWCTIGYIINTFVFVI